MKYYVRLTLAALFVVAGSSAAFAQSAIAGVVNDGVRRGASGRDRRGDEPGAHRRIAHRHHRQRRRYRIENLRPGDYVVTFSLTGFQTVKREGINLPTSFTATINAELSIGALAESVTVTGESPLVDVRSSVSQSVMNRERLDTIPTGKDPFAVGQLIAGVTTSTPDVGGTQVMQQPTLQVHGSSNNDNVFMVDGVQIQHIGFGGNQTGFYFNDGLMEEISYQTSSLPAEAPVGGVQINMIPHDGGNAVPRRRVRDRREQQHAVEQPVAGSRRSRFQGAEPRSERLRRQLHARRSGHEGSPLVLRHVPPLEREQLPGQHVHVHGRAGGRRPAPHRRHHPPHVPGDARTTSSRSTTTAASSGAATGRTTG